MGGSAAPGLVAIEPTSYDDHQQIPAKDAHHSLASPLLRSSFPDSRLRHMGLLHKKKAKDIRSKSGSPSPNLAQGVIPAVSFNSEQDLAIAQVISALETHGLEYDAHRAQKLLSGRFSHGDPRRAINLAFALRDAEDMILIEPSRFPFLGAENRGATCYLDALLFSMYSRSSPIFDALLCHPGSNPRADRLTINLRLFVNLLRSGILITHDLVDMLRNSIADCGWEDARSSAQQDTSECFGFIAEMLQMPNLTFKVHIAHGGKADTGADHKIVQERFLALSIPEPRRGARVQPIELVDLIDAYFHTKLEVRRPMARSRSTLVRSKFPHVETEEVGSPNPPSYFSTQDSSKNPFFAKLNVNGYPVEKKNHSHEPEVSMQAWQLFELVPYYSAADSSARQQDFAIQPPVVAICLKRYFFDSSGQAHMNPTPIVIPEFIDFTPFTDTDNTIGRSGKQVRLRLESAVCHRGNHVGSGHYVSVSRGENAGQWLLFDDMAATRVTQGTFQQLFGIEIPYLLFYQLETVLPRRPNRRAPSIPNFGNLGGSEASELNHRRTAPYPITSYDVYTTPQLVRVPPAIPESSRPGW